MRSSIFLAASAAVNAATWENQDNWGGRCGDRSWNSPVDIDTDSKYESVYKKEEYLPPLHLTGNLNGDVTMTNNGRWVDIKPVGDWNLKLAPNGLVRCEYLLDRFEFYTDGSNHEVNNDRSDMEFITYFKKDAGCTHPRADETMAISILMDTGSKNRAIEKLGAKADQITTAGKSVAVVGFDYSEITPKRDDFLEDYYLYYGAEMFEPCEKPITWIVSRYKEFASSSDLKKFDVLIDVDTNQQFGKKDHDAHKDAVNIGSRIVYKTFKSRSSGFNFFG